jgi:hypothetical protein
MRARSTSWWIGSRFQADKRSMGSFERMIHNVIEVRWLLSCWWNHCLFGEVDETKGLGLRQGSKLVGLHTSELYLQESRSRAIDWETNSLCWIFRGPVLAWHWLLWSLVAPGRTNHLRCLRIRFQIILATLRPPEILQHTAFKATSLGYLLELSARGGTNDCGVCTYSSTLYMRGLKGKDCCQP